MDYHTPGTVRFPFESIICKNPNAILIRLNMDLPEGMLENQGSTISFSEDIMTVINDIRLY